MDPQIFEVKKFKQDLQVTNDLQLKNNNQERGLKLLELRYQVALIIIPTIIGLWGFIGIIVSSKFFQNHVIWGSIIVEFGCILSIFLIWIWRTRVHDIFDEETVLYSNQIGLDLAGLSFGLKPSYLEYMKYLLEKKVKSRYPDFYDFLKRNKRFYCYYMKFKGKLSESGYRDIDKKSQGAIGFFLIFGVAFSVLLNFGLLIPNFNISWWLWILPVGFTVVLVLSSIYCMMKIQELIDKVTLYDSDIKEYGEEIKNSKNLKFVMPDPPISERSCFEKKLYCLNENFKNKKISVLKEKEKEFEKSWYEKRCKEQNCEEEILKFLFKDDEPE